MHEDLPRVLKAHRGKVQYMSSDLLRAFLYEFYVITSNVSSRTNLITFTLESATHFRQNLSQYESLLQDVLTERRTSRM